MFDDKLNNGSMIEASTILKKANLKTCFQGASIEWRGLGGKTKVFQEELAEIRLLAVSRKACQRKKFVVPQI